MALSIDTSSIGISRQGMVQVKESIQIDLIDESIKSFNGGCKNLIDNVDNYWHGAAAQSFKYKVNQDRAKLEMILRVLEQKMEIDLGSMAANTAIADAEVAGAIMGGTVVGSSTTGGALGAKAAVHTHERNFFNQMEDFFDNTGYKPIDEPRDRTIFDASKIQVDKEVPVVYDEFFERTEVKRTAASVANGAVSFLKGYGKFAEDVSDAAVIVGTGIASVGTGLYDGVQYVGSKITGSKYESVTAKMWDGTKAYVSEERMENLFKNFYENTDVGQTLAKYGYDNKYTSKINSAAETIGYVHGIKDAVKLVDAKTAMKGAKAFAVVGGVSSFGDGAETAWKDGANIPDGLKYAAANGAWGASKSYVVQTLLGNLNTYVDETLKDMNNGGKIVISDGVRGAIKKGINKGAKSAITDPLKKSADKEVVPLLKEMTYKDSSVGGIAPTRTINLDRERISKLDIENASKIDVN